MSVLAASELRTESLCSLKKAVGRKYRSGVDPEGLALTSRRRGALAGMMAAGAQVLRLLVLAIGAIFRPKALLIAENLCLRQQLVVLQRRNPRPP